MSGSRNILAAEEARGDISLTGTAGSDTAALLEVDSADTLVDAAASAAAEALDDAVLAMIDESSDALTAEVAAGALELADPAVLDEVEVDDVAVDAVDADAAPARPRLRVRRGGASSAGAVAAAESAVAVEAAPDRRDRERVVMPGAAAVEVSDPEVMLLTEALDALSVACSTALLELVAPA